MAVRTCSSAHCGGIDQEIRDVCLEMGWGGRDPILTRDEHGFCACYCSCLAFGTMVQTWWRRAGSARSSR
jgi:hypothetical protein